MRCQERFLEDMTLEVFLNDGWYNSATVDGKWALQVEEAGGHLGMIGDCKEFIRAGVWVRKRRQRREVGTLRKHCT